MSGMDLSYNVIVRASECRLHNVTVTVSFGGFTMNMSACHLVFRAKTRINVVLLHKPLCFLLLSPHSPEYLDSLGIGYIPITYIAIELMFSIV